MAPLVPVVAGQGTLTPFDRFGANDPKRPLKSLRAIVINFQSIKNKVHETQVLIDNADSDIILGTETWLNGKAALEYVSSVILGGL
jgi:hypothetical protein